MEVDLTLSNNIPSASAPISANYLRGVAFSTIITATFAAFWGLSGSIAVPGSARIALLLLVVLITALLVRQAFVFLRAARDAPLADTYTTNPFGTRAYGLAVVAQFVAIPIVSRMLSIMGYPDAILSAIAMIVGLHFFGLIRAFQSWRFAVVGSAMIVLGLLSLVLVPSIEVEGGVLALRAAVVGWGCAMILWAGIIPLVCATSRATRGAASATH